MLSTALPISYGLTEVKQSWTLNSHFEGSLHISGGRKNVQYPHINLNGHRMIIDSRGISVAGTTSPHLYGGTLTSSDSFLTFYFLGSPQVPGSYTSIASVITDSTHKVGLRILNQGNGAVFLEGDQSNTFTGNVEVSGYADGVVLNKSKGATAVKSDIVASNGALVRFAESNQLLKTSNVTLKQVDAFRS